MGLRKGYIVVPRKIDSDSDSWAAHWVKIKSDCLVHKEYPYCVCGRKFINECLWCKYRNK